MVLVPKKIQVFALAVLLLGAIVLVQYGADQHKPERVPQLLVPLPAWVLQLTNFGLHSATASLLWLNVVQTIGTPGVSFLGLAAHLDTLTRVDPKFSYPYAFAVLIIPAIDQVETPAALEVGKRGIENKLSDWRIPYYVGTTYHMVLKDQKNAAYYLRLAAETPGVPEGIRIMAYNYGTRSDLREQTKQIWIGIYENSQDEVVREQALDNIEHIEILTLLEQALKRYRAVFGAYPASLDLLVQKGILRAIPTDPFGIVFGTDGKGKVLSTEIVAPN